MDDQAPFLILMCLCVATGFAMTLSRTKEQIAVRKVPEDEMSKFLTNPEKKDEVASVDPET